MSNNWWANKLGAPAQPVQPSQTYIPMPSAPVYAAPAAQPLQIPNLPESAYSGKCPNCGSGNYGKMATAPEAKARCYDCGYPITQSGSGSPGIKVPTGGAVVAAKQLNTQNNFNPQTIVDRIG